MRNITKEKVTIDLSELKSLIYDYHAKMLHFKDNIYSIISIIVSIIVCLIGTTFYNNLFLVKGSIWQRIFVISLILLFIILFFESFMMIKNRKILNKNYLLERIVDLSSKRDIYYLCLVFYQIYKNNEIKIFFDYDKQWFKCFLLPGLSYQNDDTNEDIVDRTKKYINRIYRLPDYINIIYNNTIQLDSKKMSYFKNIYSFYHYRFVFIDVTDIEYSSILLESTLKLKTINELFKHKNTINRNYDIINFLRDKLKTIITS